MPVAAAGCCYDVDERSNERNISHAVGVNNSKFQLGISNSNVSPMPIRGSLFLTSPPAREAAEAARQAAESARERAARALAPNFREAAALINGSFPQRGAVGPSSEMSNPKDKSFSHNGGFVESVSPTVELPRLLHSIASGAPTTPVTGGGELGAATAAAAARAAYGPGARSVELGRGPLPLPGYAQSPYSSYAYLQRNP
mmetsp:Transcript_29724/g.69494  ORF Transcript_29724/g.69494 Transcript_29724/m.69494 type:complete len:200 (-) Transcript_29724:91-690(-)